ncbi:hypothetical protein KZ829_23460 [Actinoplanes hulinensis]|uniref:Uncharacterized protein n=1 Tax=Actinoplanes hulinensis TaxID=1144547 RepID=A0ABS7B8D6_9ACTN|nr:hypothetical protein [Actinoplanes hulinensis]MBW6436704.1 hypothetical protein [Actinoplanes hulinensis]
MNSTTRTLTSAITRLRNEQRDLLKGSGYLLGHGITSHTGEVAARLRAIRHEANNMADQLNALGESVLADDAREGWAIISANPAGRSS